MDPQKRITIQEVADHPWLTGPKTGSSLRKLSGQQTVSMKQFDGFLEAALELADETEPVNPNDLVKPQISPFRSAGIFTIAQKGSMARAKETPAKTPSMMDSVTESRKLRKGPISSMRSQIIAAPKKF
jgi:hypothetical protein